MNDVKLYDEHEERNCVAGDIIGIVGDTFYDALVVRKDAEGYEVVILNRLDGKIDPRGTCKPGMMFALKPEQIAAHLNNIPLTVKQIDDEDHLDFDEHQLKSLGYELPQL